MNFPTRIQNSLASVIDNMFIDILKIENWTIYPPVNGL
jgi:hypothetical protein